MLLKQNPTVSKLFIKGAKKQKCWSTGNQIENDLGETKTAFTSTITTAHIDLNLIYHLKATPLRDQSGGIIDVLSLCVCVC